MTDALYRPQRNWGCRVHDLVSRGMRLIVLENELFEVGILAGKGTDIIELNYKPRDLDFAWLAPGGVRTPQENTVTAPDSQSAFRESYPGGWQEMFPNAGIPATIGGVPWRQHGEVHSLPWDVEIVEDTPEACAVRFTIRPRTSPCLIEKTIRIVSGQPGFRIEERIVNESAIPIPAMWGHHITFGQPFLTLGSRISLPEGLTVHAYESNQPRRVGGAGTFPWPLDPVTGTDLRVLPERGSPGEMLFLTGFDPDDTWYEVSPPEGGPGARVSWDGATMPVLWFWQEFGHLPAYPWFGRAYCVGLEPCTTLALRGMAEALDAGTVLEIGLGEERSFWLEFTVTNDAERDPA